ncbi:MAG TPA: ATP-binding protein [Sulfurovum sp.]|uniref:GAF domain-containing hybrid sensor histidine kinase/response regulator n=1 Tax=Sulfurovum sp. TaxID=1969726 RepID=UPI002F94B7D4
MERIDADELKDLLNDATRKMKSAEDNIAINTIVENLIVSAMDSEFASLWAFNESKALLLRERGDESVREISMLDQRGVLAKCFLTLSGGIYNYIASEKEYRPETDNPDQIRMKSKIIIPLLDDDRLVGMLTAYSSVQKIKNFDEDDMEILQAMAPFMINVIYRMHPEMKADDPERVYIGERLNQESDSVAKKVEEIKETQKTTETPDTTLTFLSNTVHDIRTPANTLYGFLELLEDQIDNPRLLQYIHNAKESAQFINDLTTSILDRVSSQRERTQAKPVQVSPTKFFADIAEIFSANMFNKNITFNIYIDPLLPKEIIIEDIMLKRVIMNLISNAYKFTPSKKTILFSVQYEASSQRLLVSVKDTGIGIAKEKQDEIFKAFSQAEDATSVNYGGTGLGLSISAQYVHDLGGELKLKSELDVGSTFYFNIPVKVINKTETFKPMKNKHIHIGMLMNNDNVFTGKNLKHYLLSMGIDDENITPIKNVSKAPKKMTHLICFQTQLNDDVVTFTQDKNIELLVVEESFLSLIKDKDKNNFTIISQYGYYANTLHSFLSNNAQMKVLIVDDDRINVQLIRAMLEEEFCQIETAMDGEVALSMLKSSLKEEEPYSLVYLDKHMPKLSGTEVINEFRTFEKTESANPVFAVSISGDMIEEKQKNKHFDMYVGKPFNKKEIKETLKQAMNRN